MKTNTPTFKVSQPLPVVTHEDILECLRNEIHVEIYSNTDHRTGLIEDRRSLKAISCLTRALALLQKGGASAAAEPTCAASPRPSEGRGQGEGWTSVQDSLPDDEIEVLAVTAHATYYTACHTEGEWCESNACGDPVLLNCITHWRHLPEPPTNLQS
jgi:hypothetical protein